MSKNKKIVKSLNIRCIFICSIITYIIVLFLVPKPKEKLTWYLLLILLIIIIFYIIGIIALNYCIIKNITKSNSENKNKENEDDKNNDSLTLFGKITSLDYTVSYCSKKKIKKIINEKINLTKYIQKKNKYNLAITLLFVIILLFLVSLFYCFGVSSECLKYFIYFYACFFVIRLISRTMEINISFFDDVFDKDKSTNLNKYDRIKLAFASLLEEAFLFFGIYVILGICPYDAIIGGLHSFIIQMPNFKKICDFIPIYQTICSIILITISFATYISLENEEYEYDLKNNTIKGIGRYKGTTLNIPKSYRRKPVTEIGENAFSNITDIDVVIIPKTIKKIGKNAFAGCTNLKRVEFEEPEGWQANGEFSLSAALNDPKKAASYLTDKYVSVDWTK